MEQIARKVVINGIEVVNLDSTSAQTTDVANGKTYYNIRGYLVEGSDDTNSSQLGSINITENRAYTPEGEGQDVAGWNYINVNVTPKLQPKTVTPSEESQTVTADYGKDGLSSVTVNPIPPQYIIPSGNLDITNNGPVNVAQYETVLVQVNGTTGDDIDTNDATATTQDLLLGKTAYAKGEKITGAIRTYTGQFGLDTFDTYLGSSSTGLELEE